MCSPSRLKRESGKNVKGSHGGQTVEGVEKKNKTNAGPFVV